MPTLTIHPGTPISFSFRWTEGACTIGRAPGNHVVLDLEPVSLYQAKIERRDDDCWLVDLNSTNSTFLGTARVRETVLRDGDRGTFAEVVPFCFELLPAERREPAAAPPVAPEWAGTATEGATVLSSSTALQSVDRGGELQAGVACPGCRAFVPAGANFCPRCGGALGRAMTPLFPAAPGAFELPYLRPMDPVGGGVGVLPLLALLCGLSIIGFPLAIVLGLVALNQIRKQGGFSADRRQALAGVALGFIWLIVGAGLLGWYGTVRFQHSREQVLTRQMTENEQNVLTDLRGLARAQKLAKVIRFGVAAATGPGRYLTLAELGRLETALFNRDLVDGRAHGYRFAIRDPSAAGYTAVAEPEQPGVTGRRTFAIDAAGILRGDDLGGQAAASLNRPLAVLSDTVGAFEGLDDAIAREAIGRARRLADEKRYDESRQILDAIPEQFAMTSATQELLALKKSVDPFIVEAQAALRHEKAAAAGDDLKRAIGLLQEITELYPGYSRIQAVADELNRHQTAWAQKQDQEAQALFEQAETREREGQPQAALALYVQVEKNYPATDWARRIGDLRPALQQSIREQGAEQLLAQARNLSVTDRNQDLVNALEQLLRNYAETDSVRRHGDAIAALYEKALAQRYRTLAQAQMDAGRDTDTLARLEEACARNPDLRPALKDLFLKLYLRVGQKRREEGDQRAALALYRQYLELEPEHSEVSRAVLAQLHLAVARADFAHGEVARALNNLVAARPVYDKDPEFNSLSGSVLTLLGRFEDALPCFDRAIAAQPQVSGYLARRGLLQILWALHIEQTALDAFAGLIESPADAIFRPLLPPGETVPAPAGGAGSNTNQAPATAANPPASGAATPNDATAGATRAAVMPTPKFATVLPDTITGGRADLPLGYDALAARDLFSETIELIDQIRSLGADTGAERTAGRSPARTATPPGQDDGRIQRIRGSFELGNTLSTVHQRVLDHNARKERLAGALRRMTLLFGNGNRDLGQAIQLGADRSAGLVEIRRATREHEALAGKVSGSIAPYLAAELEVINRAYQIAETGYRNLSAQHMAPLSSPLAGLDLVFARLFDRRAFDEGLQALRQAAVIKVPLELVPLPGSKPPPEEAGATPGGR